MRAGGRRFVSTFAMVIALGFLLAMRVRDGVTWPIPVAYGVSVLIGWRFSYHLYLMPLLEAREKATDDVVAAAKPKYVRMWALVAAAGIAISSVFWFL